MVGMNQISLTRAQQTFLEEYFVVYDPYTHTSHRNFERVLQSRVHFLGEGHHYKICARNTR